MLPIKQDADIEFLRISYEYFNAFGIPQCRYFWESIEHELSNAFVCADNSQGIIIRISTLYWNISLSIKSSVVANRGYNLV